MADIATQLAARREITLCEMDMSRATDKAAQAARIISRATALFNSPMDVNLDAIDAAVGDIRDARLAYQAALDKRSELKKQLGER